MASLDLGTLVAKIKVDGAATAENVLKGVSSTLGKVFDSTNNSSKGMKSFTDSIKGTMGNVKLFGTDLGTLATAFGGSEAASVALGTALGGVCTAGIFAALNAIKELGQACIEFVASSLNLGTNFQAQMSKVQAISGSTLADMTKLTDVAREYGAKTQYSATQAAEALEYMSLAGWNAQQSSDALGGVLNLAAASAMDLGRASDIVTDYLTAFNLEASEANRLADIMAYAMSHSNTSTEQLGEAYKNCAATANSFGMSVEETTAWLGKLADNGIKAGEAGTTLNVVLARIYGQNENAIGALQEYNIAVFDASGKARKFTDIMGDMEKAMSHMNDEQKDFFLKSVAGTNQLSGFSTMCNTSVESVIELTSSLENAGGTSEKMAKTMNDNIAGLQKSINSKVEDFKLSIFTAIEPLVKMVLSLIDTALNSATQFMKPVGDLIGGLLAPIGQVFQMIMRIVQMLENVLIPLLTGPFSFITSLLHVISGALSGIYQFIDWICTAIEEISEPVSNFLSNVGQKIESIFSTLESLKAFIINVFETAKVLIDQLSSKWQNLVGVLTSVKQGNVLGIITNLNELKDVFSDTSIQIKSIWNGTAQDVSASSAELAENTIQSFENIADACGLGTEYVFSSFEEMYENIQTLDDETFGQLKESSDEYFGEYNAKMDALSEYTKAQLNKEMKGWEECHKNKTKNIDYYLQKAEYQAEREEAINRKVNREKQKIDNEYTGKLEKELQARQKATETYSTNSYTKDYTAFAKNEEAKTKKAKEEAEKRSKFSNGGGGILQSVLGGFANGTLSVPQSGVYRVGEFGPEYVTLPKGASVTPNNSIPASDMRETNSLIRNMISKMDAIDSRIDNMPWQQKNLNQVWG